MPQTLAITLQIIIALGLLNVWLVRGNRTTAYRGGDAKNIVEEFAVYGLSPQVCYLVGFLKVSCAVVLLVGLWLPVVRLPAVALVAFLMLGAVAMHAKVGDPIKKTIPAALMLTMCLLCMLLGQMS